MKIIRLLSLISVVATVAILLGACNKQSSGDEAKTGTPVADDELGADNGVRREAFVSETNPPPANTAPIWSEERQAEVDERFGFTPDESEIIATGVLQAVNERNLTYNESAGTITGGDLSAEGIQYLKLLFLVKESLAPSGEEVSEGLVSKIAGGIIDDTIAKGGRIEEEPSQAKQTEQAPPQREEFRGEQGEGRSESAAQPPAQKQPAASNQQIVKSNLVKATEIYGDWNSTQEIHRRFTAQHDKDYHEFMSIPYRGEIMRMVYRDGDLLSSRRYKYNYNDTSGELELIDPSSGKLLETMVAFANKDSDSVLYLEAENGTVTVYERQSYAGAVPDESAAVGAGEGS